MSKNKPQIDLSDLLIKDEETMKAFKSNGSYKISLENQKYQLYLNNNNSNQHRRASSNRLSIDKGLLDENTSDDLSKSKTSTDQISRRPLLEMQMNYQCMQKNPPNFESRPSIGSLASNFQGSHRNSVDYNKRDTQDPTNQCTKASSNFKAMNSSHSPDKITSNHMGNMNQNHMICKINELQHLLELKNIEIKDLKNSNQVLGSELHTLKTSSLPKLQTHYRELLIAYEDLLKKHNEKEDILKNEMLNNEKQRVYIDCLKKHIGKLLDMNDILPYFKKNSLSIPGNNTNNVSISNTSIKQETDNSKIAYTSRYAINHDKNINDPSLKCTAENYIDFIEMKNQIETGKKLEYELKNEIKRLNQEIERLNTINKNQYQNEYYDKENKINELKMKNENLDNDINKLINTIKLIQEENYKLNKEKESLLDFIEQELARYNRNNQSSIKDDTTARSNTSFSTKNSIKTKEDEMISQLQQQIYTLQQELETSRGNYVTINLTLNETQAELEKSNEKIDKLEHDINELNVQITQLNETNLKLQTALNTISLDKSLTKTKLEEDESGSLFPEKHIASLKCQIIDNSFSKKDPNSLIQINEKLRFDIGNLNKELEQKRITIYSLSTEMNDLSKKLDEKEKVITSLNEQLKSSNMLFDENSEIAKNLKSNLFNLQQDNKIFQEKLTFLNKKITEMTENENHLIMNNNDLLTKLESARDYLIHIKKYCLNKSRNDNIQSLQTDNKPSEMTLKNNDMPKKIEDLEHIYKDICKHLETRKCESCKDSDTKLSASEANITQLSNELQTLKKEKVNTERANNILNQKLIAMEYENKILDEELANLKSSITNKQVNPNTINNNANSYNNTISDLLLKKYRCFIFNHEVLDLLDELAKLLNEIEICDNTGNILPKTLDFLSRRSTKTMISFSRENSPNKSILSNDNHNLSINAIKDLGLNSSNASGTNKANGIGSNNGMTTGIESLKLKKEAIEKDLDKLEILERNKYEEIHELEQKNFELKNEIYRLMNELEINFSKFNDEPCFNSQIGDSSINDLESVTRIQGVLD